MEELQVENGNFTRIVNKVIDQLAITPMTHSELCVCLVIIRKTWGFNKKDDLISLSQLSEMTNMSKRTIIYVLQDLEAKNILIIDRTHLKTNRIRFNKYYDTWKIDKSAPQIEKNRKRAKIASAKLYTSAKQCKDLVQNNAEKVNSFAHTKDIKTITKDIIQEEMNSSEINKIIKAFESINPASKKFYGNKTQRSACEDLIKTYTFDRVILVIEKTLPKTNKIEFMPNIRSPLQLYEKWSVLEDGIFKYKQKGQINKNKVAFK